MLTIPKLATLGVLSLAVVATAAPSRTSMNDVVARGDKKGDYKDVYYYDVSTNLTHSLFSASETLN